MTTTTYRAQGPRIWTYLDPFAPFLQIWRYRSLLLKFSRRDIEGRYQGSHLGLLWSIITPLVMLLVFTFVFGVVFKSRWPRSGGGQRLDEFALVMFAGQIAFQLFAEPVGRAAGVITSVPNFVKRVVFPLEILPLSAVGASLFNCIISVAILVVASVAVHGDVPWTALLIPFALIPLLLTAAGLTWFISALAVYLRDIGNFVTIALQILFFTSPVFYPLEAVPLPWRTWMEINPLTPMIGLVRGCLITGNVDFPAWWIGAYAYAFLIAVLGFAWFRITRRGFADVM